MKSKQKLDIMDAIQLKVTNKLSLSKISAITNIPRSTIHKKYQDVIELFDADKINDYEAKKPEVLSGMERVLIREMMDRDKLKSASLNNVAYTFAQVTNANKLSRGQATQIVDAGQNIRDIEQLKAQADVLINGLLALRR